MFGRKRETTAPPRRTPDWRSFDRVAETYDRVRRPMHAPATRDLVRALNPPSPGGLLDVGTGTGVLASAAREAGWTPVVGVDRSVPMIRLAAQRADHAVAADVVDLPIRDGSFEAVTVAFALHVFPKYETALFDVLRVLRPDGRFGSVTWAAGDDEFSRTWRGVAEAYATKDLLADAKRRAAPWEQRFADPAKLGETLRDAGLRDVRIDRRQYRVSSSIDDYLAGRETSAQGRFLHDVLGDTLWERFRSRVEEEFRSRFPDPLGDTYEVLIAVARNPRS